MTRRAFKLQRCSLRVIRVQGELVGDFPETDIDDGFLSDRHHFEHCLGSSTEFQQSFLTRDIS